MSLIRSRKLGSITSRIANVRDLLAGRSERGASRLKHRRLAIDRLEERNLLSVAPADWDQVMVNQRIATEQTTLPGQSLAVDHDGDFAAVWTRYDEVYQKDADGNPVLDPDTGLRVPIIDPETGLPMTDANIYARYFTDEVQQLELPEGLVADSDGNEIAGSFYLTYNGNEVQKISITATYAPFGFFQEPVAGWVILGFDVNGGGWVGEDETTTIFFSESDPLELTANNFQKELQVLGGALTDATVTAVNPHEFLVKFADKSLGQNQPEIEVKGVGFTSGFLPAVLVSTVHEPVVVGPILVSPEDPYLTATSIEQAFLMTTESFYMGPVNFPPSDPQPAGDGSRIDYPEGPYTEPLVNRDPVPGVTVVPVLETDPVDMSVRPSRTRFDITFDAARGAQEQSSGKKNHPELLVSGAADDQGNLGIDSDGSGVVDADELFTALADVTTLKEPSPEFRVNPEEPDNPFTFLPDRFDQTEPDVAMDADGEFVITWQSEVPHEQSFQSVTDIFARRFTPTGIVALEDVEFFVDMDQDAVAETPVQGVRALVSPEVKYVQRVSFDATGAGPLVGTFRLEIDGSETEPIDFDSGDLEAVEVAIEEQLEKLGHRDVEVSVLSDTDPYQFEVRFKTTFELPIGEEEARRRATIHYVEGDQPLATDVTVEDRSGDLLTFRVNTETTNAQAQPSVDMDDAGNFAIAWGTGGQDLSFFNLIKAQRYSRNGRAVGQEFAANQEDTSLHFDPYVALSHDGHFLVTWSRTDDPNAVLDPPDGYTCRVMANVYDPGGQILINQWVLGAGGGSSAAFDMDNNFIVAWSRGGADPDNLGASSSGVRAVMRELYDAQGNFSGAVIRDEFRVNSANFDTASAPLWPLWQFEPHPGLDADGDLIISYEGFGPDVSEEDVWIPGTYFQDLINSEKNADLLQFFDPQTDYLGYLYYSPGSQYYYDDNGSVDGILEHLMIEAFNLGATDEQVGRLRALMEQRVGLLRGDAWGAMFSRFDADPQIGDLNLLMSDCLANTYRDGHNQRYILTIPSSTTGGNFQVDVTHPNRTGWDRVAISPTYQNNVMNRSRTRKAIEESLIAAARTGLNWPGDSDTAPFDGTVNVRIIQYGYDYYDDEILARMNTPWDLVNPYSYYYGPYYYGYDVLPTDVVFEITFQGEAHDVEMGLYLYDSNLNAANVEEVQLLTFNGEATGNFALETSLGTTGDMLFDPNDPNFPDTVAQDIEWELWLLGHVGATVTELPGGPPYQFMVVIPWDGANEPPIMSVPPMGGNPYPAFIDTTTLQQGSADTAPGPDFFEHTLADRGTTQGEVSLGVEPDGDFVMVWTQYEEYTGGSWSNQNIYYRRFDEDTDTAGPQVTDLSAAGGLPLGQGESIDTSIYHLVLTFDEDMMRTGFDSVSDPDNYRLLFSGIEIDGGVAQVQFGMNMAAELAGRIDPLTVTPYETSPVRTNKWEAVITLDANGVEPGIEPLGGGLYTIQALAPIAPTATTAGRYGLRDKAGNPLRHSGFVIGGADFLRDFVITGGDIWIGGDDDLLANPGRTYPESAQAVAVDADGDHIAVWTAADRVYYQIFDPDGTPADLLSVDPVTGVPIQDASGNFVVVKDAARALPVTPSITHPDFIGDGQRYATVATDADGDFVVTWTNYRGGDADVYARRFDSMGEVAGIDGETGNIVFKADVSDAFRVNQYTDDGQKWSHVAVDADGDFLVTWSSYGQEDNGQLGLGYGIYARRYDSFGMALGPEFQVNVTTVGNQQFSTIDMDAMGGFVIAWTSDQNGIGDDIIARLYESDGSPTAGPLAGEFIVNVTTDGNQRYPNVATDLSGERFVITWSSSGQDGEGWGVYARTFERSGVAGNELLVNTTTTGHQMFSSVSVSHLGNALDTHGDFVVTWSGYGDLPDELDTSGFGVFAQRFLWDGTAEDGTLSEKRINRQTVGNQWLPSIDSDGEGNFVIVWTGEGVETGMTGAYKFVSSSSPTRWAKFDSDGPIVTDVINPLDGARVLDGDVLEDAAPGVEQLVVLFGERLCMVDEAAGLNSVLNPANWSLERNGTEIVGGIKEIQFGRSVATRKCGALVTFDGNGLDVGMVPLLPGDYVLTARDMITDGLNALDGDYDGVAGTSPAGTGQQGFRFHFAVGGGGAEYRINEHTILVQTFAEPQGTGYALEQSNRTVAVDHDGDYVVVWTSYGQDDLADPEGAGVYFRMYDRNNVPLTGQVLVNTVKAGNQRDASVAMDADGEFVVVWEALGDNADGSWDVYGRRFSSTGKPLSGQFRVNTNTQHDQLNPAVGMDDFGNFVVVWGTKGQQFSNFNEVHGQLYSYRGERIGGEFQVNQAALQAAGLPSGEIEVNPAVAMDPNGSFVVAWEAVTGQINGVVTGTNLNVRAFPGTAAPLAEATIAGTWVRNPQLVSGTADEFVLVFEDSNGVDFDVFAYDVNVDLQTLGMTLGSLGVINMAQFGGEQVNPSVAVDADGDLAVVWNGNGGHPDPVNPADPNLVGDLDGEGVFLRSLNSAGSFVSVESRVNRTEAGIQQFPSIGMDRDGDRVVVWSGAGVGDRHGIFARRYNEPSDTAGPLVSDLQLLTGERIEFGAQLTQPLTHLVVVFDEEMMTSGLDSVTDARNYRLLKDGVQLMGGVRLVQFGLNPNTNKWEAALELDGNGAGLGVEPLGNGHYEIIVRNSLRDVVGNPLGRTGALPNGQDYSGEFTVTAWVGADNLVNDVTAGDQITRTVLADAPEHSPQAVAGDADGECVMVWSDTTPGQEGVYAKLYNDLRWHDSAAGRESTGPVPGEGILVTGDPTASFASVARDTDGDFVVTWSQNDGTGLNPDWNVWARRYDASGNPFGEPFMVNAETENSQRYSAVAMDQDGDFVITWQSYGQDGSGYGVYAQRYSPSGERLGGVDEVQLLTFVENPVGTFKLSWDGDEDPGTPNVTGTIQVAGNPFGIVGEVETRLNQLAIGADGKQVNQVEVYPLSLTELAIQFVGSGSSQDQAQIKVLSQAFDEPASDLTATTLADGLSGEFQVNDSVAGNQMFPAIAMRADGDFVVSWTSDASAGGQTDVYAKRFVTNDAYRYASDTPQGQRYDWGGIGEQYPDVAFAVSTDDPMNHLVEPGAGYDGVVQLIVGGGAGTGSLLSTGRHILTAAHVVDMGGGVPATSIDVWFDLADGPTVMTATQAFIHPGWNGDMFNANDLAIIVLPEEAPAEAERYDIYRGTDERYHVVDMVGYGFAGQGAEQFFDFLKRIENNVFEVYGEGLNGLPMADFYMGPGSFDIPPGKLLVYDFDSGLAQNDALGMALGIHDLGLGEEEGTSSHGDSGGPGFLYGQIVSVVSGGVEYINADSDFMPFNVSFGTVGFHTRVSAYADWIDLLSRSTGPEFLVNDTTAGEQKWSSVAMDADGDFVITWTSYGQDGGGGGYGAGYYGQEGVFAKRYSSDGSEYVYLDPATGLPVVDPITGLPRAGEFQVNGYTSGSQQHPQVAVDADGDFIIVWESFQNPSGSPYDDSPNSFGVYAQRYARNDQVGVSPFLGPNGEIGGELPINAVKAGDQRFPCVAVDDTGDTVIVWSGFGEGDAQGVFYQRFEMVEDDAGPTVADVLAVNIANGRVVLEQVPEDYVLDFDVEQMVLSFSEDLVDDSTTALESITNLNNWVLMRDGQVVRRGVSSVAYGLNRTSDPTLDPRLLYGPTNKYEVVVTVDGDPDVAGAQSLGPGEYWLTIRDYVEDQFGNRLDGDGDGTPGFGFTRTFFVTDVASGADQDGDGMPDGVGDPDVGDEDETVHFYEIGNQDSPAVASNAAGDYVVVWVETADVLDPAGAVIGQDSNIVARRFDRFGGPQGGDFIVNSYRIGDQVDPDVAMDAYGNFVVTWSGEGEVNGSSVIEDSGVFARVFDAFGKPVDAQFQVNQFRQNIQDAPSVAMDADGDLVVSWTSYGQDGEKDGVYARRYNFLGEAQSDEFLVNSTWRNRQDQSDVAMDAQGNFVVIWAGYRQSADNSEWGIYGQRYDAAGGRLGVEFLINAYTEDDQLDPQIAMNAGGDFVVTWSSEIQDGSGWGVYGRRYTAAGVPKAGEFRANQTTLHWQQHPAVSMDDAGNFVVTWTTTYQDNLDFPDQGIYARVFDADGNDLYVDPDTGGPLGEFRINATVQGDQFDSAVAMDADGDFVTVWVGPDADGNGVYSRLVRVNAPSGDGSSPRLDQDASFYYAGDDGGSQGGDATVLSLVGTSGADVFEFVAGLTPGSSAVKVNGVAKPVGSSVTSILFNGLGGQDTVLITGTAADETVQTWPGRVTFTGVGYTVDAVDVESVTVTSGGGADVAMLHDTPGGDEVLIATPTQISMSGDGFFSQAIGFRYGHGYSTGGTDLAKLYDDAQGDETFQVAPTHSVLFNDAFANRAVGFAYVHAYSRGGTDVAKLYDDPEDDETFLVSPGFSTLSNDNFFTRAVGFRYVHAYSSGGTDVGKMYEYPGRVDTFTTTPGYSVLSNDISFNRAFNFAYVHAYSSDSGDVAKLYDDPDRQDTFVGTAEAGAISNGVFSNRAVGFRYVHAYASGGNDVAKLYDDANTDDLFVGKPGDSTLSNGKFANRAVGFAYVHAYSLGGADVAKLYDSEGNDTFVGKPDQATLYGPGFFNRAVDFSTVKGYATSAGDDVAYLYDSALETFLDHLEAEVGPDGKWAEVSNAGLGYLNWVFDFEEVQATSSNPNDTKSVDEAVDFLIANGYW